MYMKKYLKKRMYISTLTIMLLLMTVISSSYAIFMDSKIDIKEQVLTVGDLQITYTGGSVINLNGITPETDSAAYNNPNDVYTFTVDNTGQVPYKYTIYLENNPSYPNNLLNHNYIRYDLNNSGKEILGTKEGGILLEGSLAPGESKTYNLRIWIGIEGLPNNAIGSEVHLNIMVNGKAGESESRLLTEVILAQGGGAEAIKAKEEPNFAKMSDDTDTGLYAAEDEYGTSYYYRGTKELLNNNLVFGNLLWKIVRINGDGSIRLIYESQIGVNSWNDYQNDNKYVGYMFGGTNGTTSICRNGTGCATANETSSNAKIKLDAWYEANIINQGSAVTNKIVDNLFCNDRQLQSEVGGSPTGTGVGNSTTKYASDYRLWTIKKPTLKCGLKNDRFTVSNTLIGNGALTYPVGLITADEFSMAGTPAGEQNYSCYLHDYLHTWTMTPVSFETSGKVWVDRHNFVGLFIGAALNDDEYFNYALRPVINISSEIIVSGEGSASDPYRVQ